ncbi:hypothetical protein [Haloarchaeobius baliensis]|uniref:hypothetical protein n=1 Tax=Haloarchaeobius baliensis TaxID=1670458 RepID=UPI003F882110
MGSTPTEHDRRERPRSADEEPFVATVTERTNDVTVCSISPIPRSQHCIESEWIAATGDSFVALDRMR